MYSLKCITWREDHCSYESYVTSMQYESEFDSESLAHERAEELVDMWLEREDGDITRFVNGKDHGAYVHDGGYAYHGVRITIE